MRAITFLLLILPIYLVGQVQNPVKWAFDIKRIADKEFKITAAAEIKSPWHVYGTNIPDGGPIPTSIHFENIEVKPLGELKTKSKVDVKYDASFGMNLPLLGGTAIFEQKLSITNAEITNIKGYIEYMSCDDQQCLPPTEENFNLTIKPAIVTEPKINNNTTEENSIDSSISDTSKPINLSVNSEISTTTQNNNSENLLLFFFLAFAGGLLALLTPCVFPMIPMTVSFFMRNSGGNKKNSILSALIFGISIILIYTSIGFLVGISSAGADFTNQLSTHWLSNSIFFILFIVFALSFLGAYEIVLPGSMASKTDEMVDKGGLLASFFLALTTVIVSFSCTGPIVGAILIESATGGIALKPILGMFAFGLAFALPFTLLALFPSVLKKMPKSGNWMNLIKVFFAFILLAFSLKFIGNIDQSYHLGLLSREVFMSIWISLSFLLGLYLIGAYKLPHDHENDSHTSISKFIFALLAFSFAFYMLSGFWGNQLNSLGALLPPSTTSIASPKEQNQDNFLCEKPKYSDILHSPYNLPSYYDYEQAKACANSLKKPLLVIFKGHACSNCKQMENKVWNDPAILDVMSKDYVIVSLYVDDKTKLAQDDWIITKEGKTLNSLGKINIHRQIEQFGSNTQPYYAIVNAENEKIKRTLGMTLDKDDFLTFLKEIN